MKEVMWTSTSPPGHLLYARRRDLEKDNLKMNKLVKHKTLQNDTNISRTHPNIGMQIRHLQRLVHHVSLEGDKILDFETPESVCLEINSAIM